MIDTISLLIPKNKMTIFSPSDRGDAAWDLQAKTDQYEKFVRNPSKTDLESGLQFPRLTGYNRKNFMIENNIRIEFSAPKLLYLNNLDELEEKDFPTVCEVLQQRLETMGVLVSKKVLEGASVSSVHFSKNVLLKDGYTSSHLISEMNKVNLRKTFDMARSRYINDGQSLYAHATTHQFIIYDKIADLNKDKKRAIDKEQTMYQSSLFPELKKAEDMIEVIRFEVRLSRKPKMNQMLEQLGYRKNPTFKDVFKEEISKKVVTHYWNKLIKERNLGLFSIALSPKDILRMLYVSNKKMKPKQAIYMIGLFMLGKDENGMRELRSIVEKTTHDRTWYRLAKDMKLASELITKNKLRDWVVQIDNSLAEFKAYKQKKLPSVNPYSREFA